MSKVRDLIQDALIEIGVFAPSDPIPAEDIQFALRTLNRMISVWNTQDLMVYSLNRETFNLVAGKQTYTLGTGGDFNIPRPVKIPNASVLINNATPTPLEIPIDILTDQEWQNISLKQTPSTFPVKMWMTGDVPLNYLWFWPLPQDSTVKIVLYCWGQVQPYTALNTDVIFPNGCDEAIVTNLALMLSSSYGVAALDSLRGRAVIAKGSIESMNMEPVFAAVDAGLVGNRGRTLAIETQGLLVDRP